MKIWTILLIIISSCTGFLDQRSRVLWRDRSCEHKNFFHSKNKLPHFISMSDKDDSPPPRVRKIWNQESNVSPYPNTNGGNYGSMSVDLTKISILEPDYAYYSFHRNVIPDYFINSLKAREVTVPEVNQQFQPTSDDIHVISTNSFAKGYVGCIFQLETAIFRLEKIYLITFLEFLNQLSKDNPNYLPVIEDYLSKRFDREQIEDWVGLPFREVLLETYLSFINPYDEYQLDLYEKKFFLLFEKIVEDNLPLIMPMIPQFVSFAQELIADQITITIMTNLPRYIAMKLLIMSGLSRFLEGKLPIEHLITPTRDVFTIDFRKHPAIKSITTSSSPLSRHQNHQLRDLKDKSMFNYLYNPQYGPHYQSKQYAYACAIMRKHTGLTLVFDRNYQHITLCKKLGMACIGLKGAEGSDKQVPGRSESNSALFSWKLRGSDLQINDYSEITIDKIYQLMKRYVKWINGPTLQRQEAPVASVKSPPSSRQRSLLPYRNEVSPAMLTELERLENRKKQV